MRSILTTIILLLLIQYPSNCKSSDQITIRIDIKTEMELFNANLKLIGENPQILYSDSNLTNLKEIRFDNEMALPFVVALHIKNIENTKNRVFLFEVDSSVLSININTQKKFFEYGYFNSPNYRKEFKEFRKQLNSIYKSKYDKVISSSEADTLLVEQVIDYTKDNLTSNLSGFYLLGSIAKANQNQSKKIKLLYENLTIGNSQMKYFKDELFKKIDAQIDNYETNNFNITDEIENDDNELVALDFSNQDYLLYIWSTWCGPCIKTIKNLNYKTISNSNINLIFISVDEDGDKWQKFSKIYLNDYNSYRILEPESIKSFVVDNLPQTILIKNNQVVSKNSSIYELFNLKSE